VPIAIKRKLKEALSIIGIPRSMAAEDITEAQDYIKDLQQNIFVIIFHYKSTLREKNA
jgi:galactitol-specific phosphotransferase system IIB component